jgi:hypothetical protein
VTSPRSQRTLLGLAVLLVAVASILLLRRGGPEREDAARSSASSESSTATPGEVEPPSRTVGDLGERASLEPTERQDPVARHTWARVFVTGRVEGARGEESKPVVIVRPRLGELGHHGAATGLAAWTYLQPDGTYRAEVSHCFTPDDEAVLAEVHVQLSSGSRLPLERIVAVPFTRSELERGGELVIPVDFELPGLCKPEISVLLSAGESAVVTVVALTVRGDAPGQELAVWSGAVEGSARVDMAVPCGEPFFLVACVDGWRPRTLLLPARASLAVLELERGGVIDGRLVSGSATHIASFTAWPAGRTLGRERRSEVGPFTLLWTQGQFEWPMPHARSDDEGAFRFSGLIPGHPYELHWRDDMSGLESESVATVRAGERSVRLDMRLRSVGISLRVRPGATRDVDVEMLATSGARGTHALSIPPDATWWIQGEVGARVRVSDRAGTVLGETTVGEGARTVLEL